MRRLVRQIHAHDNHAGIYFSYEGISDLEMADFLIILPSDLPDASLVMDVWRSALRKLYGEQTTTFGRHYSNEDCLRAYEIGKSWGLSVKTGVFCLNPCFSKRLAKEYERHTGTPLEAAGCSLAFGVFYREFFPHDLKWRNLETAFTVLQGYKETGKLPAG